MVISLRTRSVECRIQALKKHITDSFPVEDVLYVNLGDLRTVRIISFYPETSGIIRRQFKMSLTTPVEKPDAVIWLWRETGCKDFLSRVLRIKEEENSGEGNWHEIFHFSDKQEMLPMASIDPSGEWGVHISYNNEYFFGLDGLSPETWFKEGHFFVQALFRILNLPTSSLVHGACVGLNGSGVLLCARGGGGKSTLTVKAMLEGFEYVSDDYMILDMDRGNLYASPIYSFVALSPHMYNEMYDDLNKAHFLGISSWKGKYVLDISDYADRFRRHYPVKAMLFPEIDVDSERPSIVKCSTAEKGKTIVQIAHSTLSQMGFKGFVGDQKDSDFIRKTIVMLNGLECFRIVLSKDLVANVDCLSDFLNSL